MQTMTRTSVAVNDHVFALAQGADLDALHRDIVAAVHRGGGFVELMVVGNRNVSVFFTPTTTVISSVETVPLDARDDGDHLSPFGGQYDGLDGDVDG